MILWILFLAFAAAAETPPRAHHFTLQNGMRLIMLEDRDLPLFRAVALVGAGSAHDPAAQALGSRLRDPRVETLPASFESRTADGYRRIALTALKENAGGALEILRDALSAPPSGPAELAAFHRRYYFPANTLLAMSGDFTAAEMREKAGKMFAGWVNRQAPVTVKPSAALAAGAADSPLMALERLALSEFLGAAPPAQASTARGLALLKRVQQAVGGADKLAAVTDFIQIAEFQMSPGAGAMTARQINQWAAPSYFRQESELPIGRIAAYSDGSTGWLSTAQGTGPLPGLLLKQIQGDLFRSYFQLLSSDRLPGRSMNGPGGGVLEISGAGGNRARLLVDEKSGLPIKLIYEQAQPDGTLSTVEESYGGWRVEAGLKIPTTLSISQNGRKFADVTIKEQRINTGLKPEEMSKRP